MSLRSLTRSDVAQFAIVATPLAILAVMFSAAAASWRIERAKLEQTSRQLVGEDHPIDHAIVPRNYDRSTSQEHTETWKRVLSASEALNAKYGGPFLWADPSETVYETVTAPGEDWPVAEIMKRYAQDADPILAAIETLLQSDEAIWLPIVFEYSRLIDLTSLSETQQSREVTRMLRYSFLSAIHEGQTDRALMIVRAFDRLFGSGYQSAVVIDELVRMSCFSTGQHDLRQSLGLGVWSDEERQQLESIVSKPFDWDSRWEQMIERGTLAKLPILTDGTMSLINERSYRTLGTASLAPSALRSTLEYQREIASIRGAGSLQHCNAVEYALEVLRRDSSKQQIDHWLQVPMMSSIWLEGLSMNDYGSLANAFVRSANDHRFTRTVLALRQFRAEFDHWPASLADLSRVGLPSTAMTALDGDSFAYQINQQDQAIIYNQANKDTEWAFIGTTAESIMMQP